MRRRLVTVVLATSTFVPADGARLQTPTGDKDSIRLLQHESDIAPRPGDLVMRFWGFQLPPDPDYIKRKHPEGGDDSDGDGDGGDDNGDDDNTKYPPMLTDSRGSVQSPTSQNSQPISTPTTSTTSPISTPTNPIATVTVTSSAEASNGGSGNSKSPTTGGSENGNGSNNDNYSSWPWEKVVAGLIGGLIVLIVLCALWYYKVVRPKRRDFLNRQHGTHSKESDIESHVTVDLRNRPHDAGSSSDVLSSYATSALPVAGASTPGHVPAPGQVVVESAARSVSIPPSPPSGVHAEPYPGFKPPLMAASLAASQTSFTEVHPALRAGYNTGYPQSYTPRGSPQAAMPPVFPSQGPHSRSSPLRVDSASTHSDLAPAAMELEGGPPPPRYPDAVAATSQVPGPSPTSPLPVSPLSVVSPQHDALAHAHADLAAGESQYHHQQLLPYQGPRQPSYDYQPSTLPEVVSPMCQLGQTSASPPEYDESAEAALSGVNNHNYVNHHQHHHSGEEKQTLSSQQPMSRY
ncbi:hypothetical protein GGR51DRAFT_48627 [Nemania sp. FL0031]|nr:hypothetical protein GGR51DRAFT_48627 [Nemania sp. FL0031]